MMAAILWTMIRCSVMVNTAHEAQPDLGINSLNYLSMTIAIKMVLNFVVTDNNNKIYLANQKVFIGLAKGY